MSDQPLYTRSLQLPSPIRDVRALRTLILLDLESHPVDAPIERVTVTIDPTPGRVLQHALFVRAHPTPEQLSTLIARLNALMGEDRVGRPARVDSYRPGAFTMQPFATEHDGTGQAGRAGKAGWGDRAGEAGAGRAGEEASQAGWAGRVGQARWVRGIDEVVAAVGTDETIGIHHFSYPPDAVQQADPSHQSELPHQPDPPHLLDQLNPSNLRKPSQPSHHPDLSHQFAPLHVPDPCHPPHLSHPPHPPQIVSALRRCRRPVPARVVMAEDRPVAVTTDRRGFAGGRVLACAGPWRSSGEWWLGAEAGRAGQSGEAGRTGQAGGGMPTHQRHPSSPRPHQSYASNQFHLPDRPHQSHQQSSWNRDEWDVSLSDGGMYRIFQDRDTDRWFIDAIVD